MKVDQAAALKVGKLAWDMARGYLAHIALIRVPPRLRPQAFVQLIRDYPTDFVLRKDGTKWEFGVQDAIGSATWDEPIPTELPRVWPAGSLLAVGDALARNDYFDRAPVLELVRHLRNGIAHGNSFRITNLDRPAHNRDAGYSGPNTSIFEITAAHDGQPVLFDFIGAGDVLDLLYCVGNHLKRFGGELP